MAKPKHYAAASESIAAAARAADSIPKMDQTLLATAHFTSTTDQGPLLWTKKSGD